MFFLKKFFKLKTEDEYDEDYFDYDLEYEDPEWDKFAGEREPLDLNNTNVQEQYVRSLLEQLKNASDEIDHLKNEYEAVSGYLRDMEEVEEIPAKEREEIEKIAKHIRELRAEHDRYVLKESNMSDKEYKMVETYEEEIARACDELEQEEEMKKKIKHDLSRLDREKNAYAYRRSELEACVDNSKGVCMIIMGTAVVLTILLFLMQVGLELDVRIGYYLTIALTAVALTVVYVKYVNYSSEKARVSGTINELIILENKVKIRYVNNKNLLDYLYMKYDVPDAWTLRDLYTRFEKEREAKQKFRNNEIVYQDELAKLVKALRRFNIHDPEMWIHQVDAIVDSKEMVESRHGFISRRQKLRKRMEYNQNLAKEASEAIKAVIKEYPESADRILELVNIYEKGDKQ